MVTPQEKLSAAVSLVDPLKKQMTIAAIICGLFRDAGAKAVMVGGSAVEFYTAAQYITRDIDFITDATDRIKVAMESLGFVNKGGTWVLPSDPTVVVEFPKGPLAGSSDRVVSVRVESGIADVIGLEDIIVDRMSAETHWKDGSEELAVYMALAHYDEIDWKYCLEAARKAECFEETKRLRDRVRRQRSVIRAGV